MPSMAFRRAAFFCTYLWLVQVVLAAPYNLTKRVGFPDYVLQYAPLAHLHSEDRFMPSEITTHLQHVTPQVDFEAIAEAVSLETLSSLGEDVYLTSNDNVLNFPSWLLSSDSRPDANGVSRTPATIIAVEKDGGILDAFYFYFYSYNQGNTVLGVRYGDHVGDWEHSMVRFVNGVPQFFYLSAHSGGFAFEFNVVESQDGRPVHYIATGSHANYPTAGSQPYTLPFGLLADNTDAGPIWDVTQNYRGYWFDRSTQTFSIAQGAGPGGDFLAQETVDWLYFPGRWGDEQYPWYDLRHRQYCLFDITCRFVGGPTGPLAKNLGRNAVCQNEADCEVQSSLRMASFTSEEPEPFKFDAES